MRARRLVELASLAWLLLAGAAQAQQVIRPYSPLPSSSGGQTSQLPGTDPAAQLLSPAPSLDRIPLQLTQGRADRATITPGGADDEAVRSVIVQLEPPTAKRLFRLESEQAWRQRIRQDAYDRPYPDKIVFPDEPILTRETFKGRHWPAMHMVVEPYFVGYNRLYFNQINFERYGWDLGPVTSLVSGIVFFKDLVLLPYHHFTDPWRVYDYNTGYCLPGDPVPLRLYPEEGTSATGLLAQAGAIVLVLVVFP